MKLTEPENWQSAYYEYLYNFAKYKIDDKELIKDLIQDTFLAAIQRREKFKQECSEITWLTAILKYKIYKIYRYKKKAMITYINNDQLSRIVLFAPSKNTQYPEVFMDPMDVRNFEKELKLFVGTLPLKWQSLYSLKYLSNENTSTICRQLQLSENNYWVISYRLRAALRDWYLAKWN